MVYQEDPYAFILQEAYISPSQQRLLDSAPFFGSVEYQQQSSRPETHLDANDLNSLPSSGNVDLCIVNNAVGVDAGTKAFVDLGTSNELGFSQPNPTTQQIDVPRVPETESSETLKLREQIGKVNLAEDEKLGGT